MSVEKNTPHILSKAGIAYTALPNAIANKLKLPESLAIWFYLYSKPEGWKIRPDDIKKRWNLGRDRYLAAMRELREIGVVWDFTSSTPDGTIKSRSIVCSNLPFDVLETLDPSLVKHDKPQGRISGTEVGNGEYNDNDLQDVENTRGEILANDSEPQCRISHSEGKPALLINKRKSNKEKKETYSRCHDDFCADVVEKMIGYYVESMPHRPRPRDFMADRSRMLAAKNIWSYGCKLTKSNGKPIYADEDGNITKQSALTFWKRYFQHCAKSNFLCHEMKGFNFDWAIKKSNFNKIREGNYHG